MSAEDIEAGVTFRTRRRRQRARRSRILIGLVFSLATAGGIGWALGLNSHATAAELTAESTAAHQKDLNISKEVNRTLLELWKMEDTEAMRNSGRIR